MANPTPRALRIALPPPPSERRRQSAEELRRHLTSPITKASGNRQPATGNRQRKVVQARYARNRRLADALQQWALGSMRGSPGARAYYQALRDRGISHHAALRQLANRLVGILHGCLKTRTHYDEHTAWDHHIRDAA